MSSNKLPQYFLLELPNITEAINSPLKTSQRIKYTCFDVSKSVIAFGATSGGIYIFSRSPCEFIQLIPNKDGAITRISISPNEQHIGFANGKGLVTVNHCDQKISGGLRTTTCKEHHGNEVTAMVWSGNNMLISGDDVGRVSIMQLSSFITKTIFQNSSQTIMNLDSRICQLDIRDHMLLVSTLTRSYVCNTEKEQYRQIGQKLRDGEYGACFVITDKIIQNSDTITNKDYSEVKKFNIVDEAEIFADSERYANTVVYCARPSSRLWEAQIDGTVKRTHQYKQVLSRNPINIISFKAYNKEDIAINEYTSIGEGHSCNFPKIFSINNSAIFSFKKDAIYFLNIHDVDNTLWSNSYKDIVDCKLYHDNIYVWLQNGSLINLRFLRIDKFLIKCYLDEKFTLCVNICALFSDYILSSKDLTKKLHILIGLRDKIQDKDKLQSIARVLEKVESLKNADATQMKSGIYVVDNTFATSLSDDENTNNNEDNKHDLQTEALQTLKDLSVSVTDKLNTSKKILKEKWGDFEERVKNLSLDKSEPVKKENTSNGVLNKDTNYDTLESNVLEKDKIDFTLVNIDSGQNDVDINQSEVVTEKDNVNKKLYQCFRLISLGINTDTTNLLVIVNNTAKDIADVHKLMLVFEEYCHTIGAFDESKYAPNYIFLTYLTVSENREVLLEKVMENVTLCKYFVDSCIKVNKNNQKLNNVGCECGYPLPYIRTKQVPIFSEIIDSFIDKQWLKTKDDCYDVCKHLPYLWRKILYLRRNEDLMNILRLLLQMLDENLLHSFLPQFTLDAWDKTVQLYAVLHSNRCLNCMKSFDHISVKNTLNWDGLGALMIKSIGGKNAIKLMEKHADLIDIGELTMKFYHTCFVVTLFEKYDSIIVNNLTDAMYSAYEYDDAIEEISKLLRSTLMGNLKNTALPLIVAAKSRHWGLGSIFDKIYPENGNTEDKIELKLVTLDNILANLNVCNGNTDCSLCGLPLVNEVLIRDGGLWVFKCGHIFHGACLDLNKLKLCPSCSVI